MTAVRNTIDADPIFRARVYTTVGTECALRHRSFDWLLVEYLLEPVVIASRAYRFDESVFDLRFDRGEGQPTRFHTVEFLRTDAVLGSSPGTTLTVAASTR